MLASVLHDASAEPKFVPTPLRVPPSLPNPPGVVPFARAQSSEQKLHEIEFWLCQRGRLRGLPITSSSAHAAQEPPTVLTKTQPRATRDIF